MFFGVIVSGQGTGATTLVRFRSRLIKSGMGEELFKRVIEELESGGVVIKKGTLIDATVVKSARKGAGKRDKGSADEEAGWAVKGGEATDGYKAHIAVDEGKGVVRKVMTTAGNVHDRGSRGRVSDGR